MSHLNVTWALSCLALALVGCQSVGGPLQAERSGDAIAYAASLYFADNGPLDHLAYDRGIPAIHQSGRAEQFRILDASVAQKLDELSRQHRPADINRESIYGRVGIAIRENGKSSTRCREIISSEGETFDSLEVNRIFQIATFAYMEQCEEELARSIRGSKLIRIVADSRILKDDPGSSEVNAIALDLPVADSQIPLELAKARPASGGNWLTRSSVRIFVSDSGGKSLWCDLPQPSPTELETLPSLRAAWTKLQQSKGWRPATDEELRPRVRIIR